MPLQTAEVRKRFAGANTSMQKQSMRKSKAFLKYMLLMNQVESRKVSIRVTPFTPYSTIQHRRINRKLHFDAKVVINFACSISGCGI